MVVLLKKLTYGALLSPSEASEEFRQGIFLCFRALLFSLCSCSHVSCSCNHITALPALSDDNIISSAAGYASDSEQCLLAFLRSQTASPAVGHWLSLLLKVCLNLSFQKYFNSNSFIHYPLLSFVF